MTSLNSLLCSKQVSIWQTSASIHQFVSHCIMPLLFNACACSFGVALALIGVCQRGPWRRWVSIWPDGHVSNHLFGDRYMSSSSLSWFREPTTKNQHVYHMHVFGHTQIESWNSLWDKLTWANRYQLLNVPVRAGLSSSQLHNTVGEWRSFKEKFQK